MCTHSLLGKIMSEMSLHFLSLNEAIIKLFDGAKITHEVLCGGGCISTARRIRLNSGKELFYKKNNSIYAKDIFEVEAYSLVKMKKACLECNSLYVPQVYAFGDDYILMEYINEGHPHDENYYEFGYDVAQFHKNTQSSSCGLTRNTFAGTVMQDNSQSEDWVVFFKEKRLLPILKAVLDKYLLDKKFVVAYETLCKNLSHFLLPPDDGRASLLHGDLWAGNHMWKEHENKTIPVFIDPAIYYGHREVDIALTTLFGGYPKGFYNGYSDSWPLEKNAWERLSIYSLYHIMIHMLLFGISYYDMAKRIVYRYS